MLFFHVNLLITPHRSRLVSVFVLKLLSLVPFLRDVSSSDLFIHLKPLVTLISKLFALCEQSVFAVQKELPV